MKTWATRASKMTVPRVGLNGEGNNVGKEQYIVLVGGWQEDTTIKY